MFRHAKKVHSYLTTLLYMRCGRTRKMAAPSSPGRRQTTHKVKVEGRKSAACWTFCPAWSLIGCLRNYLHGVDLSANARKWQRVVRQVRRWETPRGRRWINPLNHSLQGKWIKPLKWEFYIGNIHNVHLILRISTTSETMSYSVLCR